jgi:hypothetical protein
VFRVVATAEELLLVNRLSLAVFMCYPVPIAVIFVYACFEVVF